MRGILRLLTESRKKQIAEQMGYKYEELNKESMNEDPELNETNVERAKRLEDPDTLHCG